MKNVRIFIRTSDDITRDTAGRQRLLMPAGGHRAGIRHRDFSSYAACETIDGSRCGGRMPTASAR